MQLESERTLAVLQKALWNKGIAEADEALFGEMKAHAVASLAAPVLGELSLTQELLSSWKKYVVQHVYQYQNMLYQQSVLPVSVPYVILKGTSAGRYYPHPEYRAYGDIDIMTRHEDYQAACEELANNGHCEVTNAVDVQVNRHREFERDGIHVEVHYFYALRDNPAETQALDELIIEGINDTHVLSDLVNGLTLVEHINHHMEAGLGLRQIIDWMMFVDKCLPDEQWPDFEKMAARTGHVRLAQVTTRMCEIYLGLSPHVWCDGVDPMVCEKLMAYVLSCGNFGVKVAFESRISERILSSASLPATVKTLRQQGILTWKAAQKYAFLRPFAWIYKAGNYLIKGLTRKNSIQRLKDEYVQSRKRNELFDAVGISREKKGRAIYKNGRYMNDLH